MQLTLLLLKTILSTKCVSAIYFKRKKSKVMQSKPMILYCFALSSLSVCGVAE